MAEHPQAGVDYPRNWHELLEWFSDEGACLRYLERLRWGDGFTCRFCGSVDGGWRQMADGLRRHYVKLPANREVAWGDELRIT